MTLQPIDSSPSALIVRARRLASRLKQKIAYQSGPASTAVDPFHFYESLRAQGPAHFLPQDGVWLIIGYQEVCEALADASRFSSQASDWTAVDQVLLGADPPAHTASRRVANKCFSNQGIDELITFSEETAARLIQPLKAGKTINVHQDFSIPLTEEVAAKLIGFDAELLSAIRQTQQGAVDLAQWLSTLETLIARAAPNIKMYQQLMHENLGANEARSLIRFFWLASTTTTRRAISSSILQLLKEPTIRSDVELDQTLLPGFVEESIRLHPPEHSISRVTSTESNLGGVNIPAGVQVALCLAAANRDPHVFEEPDQFRLDRIPNRHISFGVGIHRCLGAAIARVEVSAALRVLFRDAPRFKSIQPLEKLSFVGFTNDSEQLFIKC